MPDSNITKRALSAAMKELMAERPMEKIRIGDIVERCNMNRQSFYYHFRDKYDLVNWIFYTEFFADIQRSFDKPGWELIEKMCQFFYENRTFYTNALQVRGQNSFSEYFNEVMHPLILARFDDIFADDPDRDFYATFLADSIRVTITRWLLEGAKLPPERFIELLKKAVTGLAYKIVMEEEQDHSRSNLQDDTSANSNQKV
ncbi:MAG TPA: TetR/AcrR family transcriptional regulator C-terminal domain-containing protein [Syntrophomonadaceae bacterium]|nr:TetR/AcrR family transcriptional regulator C-terminal domain-containing protein [Syntrophomonadaceae bacterium]HPU49054.1 TetR/AcrR family transcriptional regulator C-terminal domain-containing protein [Syntrophomonadaceae bacterium]